jgi:hypothetical protein
MLEPGGKVLVFLVKSLIGYWGDKATGSALAYVSCASNVEQVDLTPGRVVQS